MTSMIYDLARVEDRGMYWQVTNVEKNTLDGTADRNEKVLRLSYMTNEIIREAIMNGQAVHISKTLISNEVLPGDVTIITEDQIDPLQASKNAALVKVRMLVTPEMAKIAGLTLYGFIILNNDLINAGYAITNQNREEKYLEILETGDEALIQKLEDYLNYKDEIESVAHMERKFTAFRDSIRAASTVEEILDLQNKFLESYYSKY